MSGQRSSTRASATAVALFERVFAAAPDRPALVVLDNGETESARLTRRELRTRVAALAATLQATTEPGERALLVYPSGHDFAIAYLACLYAAIVPVPCYPPSRNRTDHRLAGVAADSEARIVLTTDKIAAGSATRFDGYPALKDVRWISTSRIDLAQADRWSLPAISGDTTALIQYTSGSTSDPRGVVVSHGNLLASFRDMALGADQSSVMVTWLPMFHDMGLIYGLLQPLADGFLCVMMPPAAFLQQPVRWLRAFTKYRGTHSAAPNFAYDLCASRVSPEVAQTLDLSTWKVAINAAEPVRADTLERFAAQFATSGFDPHTFLPGYGLAEATIRVTATPTAELPLTLAVDPEALKVHRVEPATSANARVLVSSGKPVPETTVLIVDPETLQPCAPDRIGEIWVGGRTVAQGYFKNAAASAATFGAQLAGDDTRYLRTGDLGFVHEGSIYITGRLKDVIILRGLNYYPQDLESTVEQCHPALAASGAAAFGIELGGEERLAIVAEVVRTERRKVDANEVFAAIHRALSDAHELSVDRIALIDPHALPKTSSGKVRRKACREALEGGALAIVAQWERPAVTAEAGVPGVDVGAALKSVRDWLVARFATRLACPPASIDTKASLAQFGLNSLEAVALSDELEQLLGRPIAVGLLYDHPTIDSLARHLAGAPEPVAPPAAQPDRSTQTESGAIAVIGMGCRFPGADGPQAFWRLLRDGVDAVGPLPGDRTDIGLGPSSAFAGARRHGGFLENVALFEPAFFGISPREADRMDPQQRLMLEVGWEAFEDAGLTIDAINGSHTGVFVGITNSDFARLLMNAGSTGDMYLGTGSALSINANRLSYVFDLKGPSLAVDTACSSSLVALSLACASLRRGECDMALAGGVNLTLTTDYTESFAAAGMLAADGRCKTFDATADGYVRGEGAGLVVLKRLEHAERDGDRILAVVRGVATNQDGRSAGLTAPNGPAQQDVVRAALRDAGLPPSRVSYVEAHGTGTPLGDPIELNSLAAVLSEGRPGDQPCRVGSVKTNLGHLEGAAGAAGFIKAVLSLQHREIPASLNFRALNPRIKAGGHIEVNSTHHSWRADDGQPRVAGVSSFGFGGTNAHIVLEEYAGTPRPASAAATHVLTVSARDHNALTASVDRHLATLSSTTAPAFGDLCLTSNVGRTAMTDRLAVVASSASEAATMLRDWRAGEQTSAARAIGGRTDMNAAPGVAFLFTGQGASWPGMGLELYRHEPVYARAIAECSEILWPILGASLEDMLFGPTPDPLRDIVTAHTATFATQYALSQVWAAWGVTPAAVIGHSLGEFAAAQAAGAVALEDALTLVATRAQLLQSIEGDGVMFAAQARHDVVEAAITPWRADLSIAAINAPTNIVVSGRRVAAAAAAKHLTEAGIKCTMLPHAQGFHSPLVDGILDDLAAAAARIRFAAPRIPFFSTATGTWLRAAPDASYWRHQVRTAVRFVDAIVAARESGLNVFLEFGPHPALVTLGEQIAQDAPCTWAASLHGERPARTQMLQAAAGLWTAGVALDWSAVHRESKARKTSLPTYPFQRTHHWIPQRSEPPTRVNRPSHTYARQWLEREAAATTSASGLAWIIFADDGGTANALAATLAARGDRTMLVRRGTTFRVTADNSIEIAPRSASDYVRAIAHASQQFGRPADRVAHLWSLDATGKPSVMSLKNAVADGALSAVYVTQALLAQAAQTKLWLVTSRATAAGAVVTDSGLLQSAIWGVGQTLAVEDPAHWGALIDLDDEDAATSAERLAGEITQDEVRDTQVSFREGRRLVASIVAAEPPLATRVRINADATYLITGGLGTLGLAVATALADGGAKHLILVSRTGANTDARRSAIEALAQAGVTVRAPILDVSDEAAVGALIREIKAEQRPLAGVVHAAGETGFTPTGEMTAEIFESVFAGKALGGLALARATASIPLDFFVTVSSMTTAWGSAGQTHYVAASHFLDILAQRMRQVDHPGTSVALGPLQGGMLPAVIASRLARRGIATFEMSYGAELLLRFAGGTNAHAVAVEIDWELFTATQRDPQRGARAETSRPAARPAVPKAPTMKGALVERLNAADAIDRERLMADAVVREAAAVMGLKAADWGDRHRGFFDLGMDSLTATELRKRFEQLLGRRLPATLVFDHPNADALHRALFALVSATAPAAAVQALKPSSPQAREDDALALTLERLERLVARQ